jgi:membrane protease YdiL (CAAX protease family)
MTAAAPAATLNRVWLVTAVTTLALGAALSARDVWFTTGLAALLALALAALVCPDEARRELGQAPRGVGIIVLGAAVLCSLPYVAYPTAARTLPALAAEVEDLYAWVQTPPGPLAALPVLVAVVVCEEVIYRGLLYRALKARTSGPWPTLIAVAIYTLPQIGSGSWALWLLAAGCGLVWTLQRAWTGSLWAPLVTHLLFNLVVLVTFPLATPSL